MYNYFVFCFVPGEDLCGIFHAPDKNCAIVALLFTLDKQQRTNNVKDVLMDMFVNARDICHEKFQKHIGIASLVECKRVLNDDEFVFNRECYTNIGRVRTEVIQHEKKADQKRSNDRKSRYVTPKKVPPMI